MTTAGVEKLIWTLVYGGLLLACLGVFVRRDDDPVGWALVCAGAAAVAAGAVLIWLRSRMRGDTTTTTATPASTPAATAAASKTNPRDTTR